MANQFGPKAPSTPFPKFMDAYETRPYDPRDFRIRAFMDMSVEDLSKVFKSMLEQAFKEGEIKGQKYAQDRFNEELEVAEEKGYEEGCEAGYKEGYEDARDEFEEV